MDEDVKANLSSLILSLMLVVSLTGWAGELEYISPDRSQALAKEFASAHWQDTDRETLAKKSNWSCAMYGVRTRMQVQKAAHLYDWTPAVGEVKASLSNMGTHPVSRYSSDVESGALVGQTERLRDEVRITTRGQIISKLMARGSKSTVLAYSVCDAL